MTEIRLHDIPAEVAAFAAEFGKHFDVVSDSGDYPDRGASRKVRRYLDIRIRQAREVPHDHDH